MNESNIRFKSVIVVILLAIRSEVLVVLQRPAKEPERYVRMGTEGRRAKDTRGEGGREAEEVSAAIRIQLGLEGFGSGVGLENENQDPREP
jgi:hypothetical protein